MKNLFKLNFLWNWDDFGIMFKIFKNGNYNSYYFSIDIQIMWLNLWIEAWRKNKKQ